jgi:HPt (histidine-containing phosphotransfer) domain-containing protein
MVEFRLAEDLMSELAMRGGDNDPPDSPSPGRDAADADRQSASAAVPRAAPQALAFAVCCGATGRIPWARVLRELGGDSRVLGDLAAAFRDEGPQLVAQMHSALATSRGAALLQAVHTLRGSLQIFHTEELLQLARQIELLGRTGDLSGAAEMLPQLDAGVAELCREMAAMPVAS